MHPSGGLRIAPEAQKHLKNAPTATAAVIVTYNSEQVIDACLDALEEMTPDLARIVVDNASTDRTRERLGRRANLHLIANDANRGFAAAVNQGVAAADADFVLLLNPDVRLLTAVDQLTNDCRRSGLAAGKLVDQDGRAQKGFTIRRFPTPLSLFLELAGVNRLWPGNPSNRHYRYLDRDLEEPGAVEQPAGAFLMMRKDIWRELGGFDESFRPVWFEDVDFCKRAVTAGYKIQYVPRVTAEHQGGHSVRQVTTGCRAVYWCDSLLRYAFKHFRPGAYRGICLAVVFTSIPRMVAGMIHERSLSTAGAYIRVVRLAGQRFFSARSNVLEKGRI